jgi:hypothetical protein
MLRSALLLLLAGCGSSDPVPAPVPAPVPGGPSATVAVSVPPSPNRTSGPLTRFEAYSALFAQSSLPLSQGEHCNDVVGVRLQRAATLGDWLAYNLQVVDEMRTEGAISLPFTCAAAEGHPSEWECTIEFSAGGDGESPWRWGVRARFRDADASLVTDSLLCTGAG